MTPATILEFVNLFFAGLLAGAELVIHYGVRAPAETLDEPSQVRLRQALIVRLRVLVPALFLPTAITGVAVLALDGLAPGSWFRVSGVIGVLIWISTRVIGTVRINSDTMDWLPDAPPKNWRALVDHAERFHVIGVWATVAALASFLTAVALRLTAR
jgi:hypothetical protein